MLEQAVDFPNKTLAVTIICSSLALFLILKVHYSRVLGYNTQVWFIKMNGNEAVVDAHGGGGSIYYFDSGNLFLSHAAVSQRQYY